MGAILISFLQAILTCAIIVFVAYDRTPVQGFSGASQLDLPNPDPGTTPQICKGC